MVKVKIYILMIFRVGENDNSFKGELKIMVHMTFKITEQYKYWLIDKGMIDGIFQLDTKKTAKLALNEVKKTVQKICNRDDVDIKIVIKWGVITPKGLAAIKRLPLNDATFEIIER